MTRRKRSARREETDGKQDHAKTTEGRNAAQGQNPDTAKLKADTENMVKIISGDKFKIQTYCQFLISRIKSTTPI
jgi:hypothetical protein